MHGIIICLENSNNLDTIEFRTNKIITDLFIQKEKKNIDSPTIGCFNAHIKALKYSINLMENNLNIKYVIIGEEDIEIDYNSTKYKLFCNEICKYDNNSNYILHLGGFPGYTDNLIDYFTNFCTNYIKAKIFLATAYIVNVKIAKELLNVLMNTSNNIHCDSIFAYSKIEQRLIKGNIVSQLALYNSNNSYFHNFLSVKTISKLFIIFNKFSIIFSENYLVNLFLMIYYLIFVKEKFYLIFIVENFIIFIKYIKYNLVNNKKITKYMPRDIYLFLEILRLIRIISIFNII